MTAPDEHAILSRAVMALGDRLAHPQSRLDEIERALCRPLPPEERRALRAEYLDRTNPRKDAA